MRRVVFDTVVFVRALINPRSHWGRLLFENSLQYRLFVSQQILIEILEVLQRPKMTAKFHTLFDRDIKRVLQIISQAEVVEISDIPKVSRDVKDDKFLATAKAANADYLISADRDLLDLKEYQGIKIITAEDFLNTIEQG